MGCGCQSFQRGSQRCAFNTTDCTFSRTCLFSKVPSTLSSVEAEHYHIVSLSALNAEHPDQSNGDGSTDRR